MSSAPKTLYDKLWDAHVVVPESDSAPAVLYIDLHLIHEVTSPQAFTELRERGLKPRRPDRTKATMDHSTPTLPAGADGKLPYASKASEAQVEMLAKNCAEYGIELFDMASSSRGIVHVIAPEQGFTQPGMTIVCGDSHTSTHGAFGALAFGIGTSEVGHVLATQCLLQRKAKTMAITVDGELAPGVGAKDVVLHIIGVIGVNGGTGHVIEYRGSAIRAMDMEQRMTLCNMSIEAGARAGMVAPDQVTFDWVAKTPRGPRGADFDAAVAYWKTLRSDEGARFDVEVRIDAADIRPTLTWGTHPGTAIAVDAPIPAANDAAAQKGLDYMKFEAGHALAGTPVDVVFVGSCTNGRIDDMRMAAKILKGRAVSDRVRCIIIPATQAVWKQCVDEGLMNIFVDAGAAVSTPTCGPCLGGHMGILAPGERCVSTTNRNFVGRMGHVESEVYLASPAVAAASAITGYITGPQSL